ncbi:hypothetical protein DUI87_17729 [Hirundo rustica rustica]|uniref:Reverse transcriptase/retrotransposon-derived protein RNase H-like domain-containing protein n=1 Tax=Hirundo rustica rustica TaxID=333673 RepID=A0A3M0K342_HIRRU|nr:hypothetical protein DUI87_17729 [Hirundo rustica rustica]
MGGSSKDKPRDTVSKEISENITNLMKHNINQINALQHQIPTEVINKITTMSPPTNKKEIQAFLGATGFWRTHIPEYSQIVSPLYLVPCKKNDFHWGPEQQQAFAQIKQEIAHVVALGPGRMRPEVKNVLYSAAGNNGSSWSLWQKVPGETRG